MSNEEKADKLCADAEKKLKGWKFFGNKYEEAVEMYQQAGNHYKMAKQWHRAGESFRKCADLHLQLQSKHDAQMSFQEAATAFKKTSVTDAVTCLKMAITMQTENGRFTQAAKAYKEIGEMYESESDLALAIENYQQAADYYLGEEQPSAGNQCLLKVAAFSAQIEDYARAIETYEQVSRKALEVPLLRYSVKEYFFHATLCHLAAGDDVGSKSALERYKEMDVQFGDTREAQMLDKLIAALEEGEVQEFTDAVTDFDSITKLDAWKTSILLKIKNNMQAQDFT